jgi:hypothetical protein
MKEFNKTPIAPMIYSNNEWITDKYDLKTITIFPSITIFTKTQMKNLGQIKKAGGGNQQKAFSIAEFGFKSYLERIEK